MNSTENKSLRILIVDDNVDSMDSLALLMRLFGHEVDMALGGAEAVTAARLTNPDVIFMDIGMSGVDGWEATQQIRGQSRVPGPMMVAITGRAGDEDRQRSREAGFDFHFIKPADPAALSSILAALAKTRMS